MTASKDSSCMAARPLIGMPLPCAKSKWVLLDTVGLYILNLVY